MGIINGRLYNYSAVVDVRNIAPMGWHVPSYAEWTTLQNYLIANGGNYDGTTTGNKIAKSLASTTGWNVSSTTGTIGNTDYPSKRNFSGFSATPSGARSGVDGTFNGLGTDAAFRTTDNSNETSAVRTWLHYNNVILGADNYYNNAGYSVRCIRDGGNTDTTAIDYDGNKYTSVTIGTQTWLVQNLSTTKFRTGEPILNVTDNNTWVNLNNNPLSPPTTSAYCDYNNNSLLSVEMKTMSSVGIKLDYGIVPIMNRVPFQLSSVGVKTDWGIIPPKNYFQTSVSSIGIKTTYINTPRINTFGIEMDYGIIPIMNRQPFKLNSFGVDIDYGVIPPKNYFKTSINTLGIDLDVADNSRMIYQVEPYVVPKPYYRISEDGNQMVTEYGNNNRIAENGLNIITLTNVNFPVAVSLIQPDYMLMGDVAYEVGVDIVSTIASIGTADSRCIYAVSMGDTTHTVASTSSYFQSYTWGDSIQTTPITQVSNVIEFNSGSTGRYVILNASDYYFSNNLNKSVKIGNGAVWVYYSLTCSNISSISGGSNTVKYLTHSSSGTTQISTMNFEGCTNLLGTLTIPNGTTYTGVFYNCNKLTNLVLPDTLTTISNNSFGLCSGLSGNLIIPQSVTYIGDYAFQSCVNLSYVYMSDNVTYLGHHAFFNNYTLLGAVLSNSLTSISSYAFANSGILTIDFPSSITSIGSDAFYGCGNMSGIITIPNSVTTIMIEAFANCTNVTTFIIGSGVTSIGSYTFGNCNQVSSMKLYPPTAPSVFSNSFTNINKNGTLHTLASGYSGYDVGTWGTFINQIHDL